MARPTKQGIDYFPMDCNNDSKLELYIAEAGIESFGILIFLWQMIYRDQGYFIDYDKDLVLLLRKNTLSSPETIENAIQKAIKRGLFSEKLYKKYTVLTSSGIQKRYFSACKKKKTVAVRRELLLVDVSDSENVVLEDGNPVNDDEKPTKETRVNKKKIKEYTETKIVAENFHNCRDKILEFVDYRMGMSKQKQYRMTGKESKGVNGLFRDLHGCTEKGFDANECIEITMERGWLTPNPEYFNNKGTGSRRFQGNVKACYDFINEGDQNG